MEDPFKIGPQIGRSGSLEGKFRNQWVENSVDFDIEDNPHVSISHTKSFLGKSISPKVSGIFSLLVLTILGIIIGKIFYLQVIRGEHYRSLAEGNRVRLIPVPSERGIIYDRNGRELVQNIPGFTLVLVPQDLPRDEQERERVFKRVSEISSTTPAYMRELVDKYRSYGYQSIAVQDNLNYTTALQFYLADKDLPGIQVESGTKRKYLTGVVGTASSTVSLSHVLGYLSRLNEEELADLKDKGYLPIDSIGKAGLEKIYEGALRGTYGRRKIEVNAWGKQQTVLAEEAPIPGKNLITTIDLEAQAKLESLVRDTAGKTGKKRIAAIAMDPTNGEIIALVSWPTFNNNFFSGGIDRARYSSLVEDADKPLFNRAIGGSYPPGSTAKLMVAAAALEEGVATPATSVVSRGGIQLGNWYFKDWQAGGHGVTNVTKAIAWSVNTYFYYIGGGFEKFAGLGVDRIAEYMKYFGVGQRTGIDLTGESSGFVPTRDWKKKTTGETWFVGDTYNLSIGQGGLLVSPLHVALWTAAIANKGEMVTPHVGKEMVDPLSKTRVSVSFPAKEKIPVSRDHILTVQRGMRDCVLVGSCKLLQGLPFASAGKTGTAQWSKTKPTHAWFTSFAPYENPKIVVTVLVESGGEGAAMAMPIAKNFLDWWGKKFLD